MYIITGKYIVSTHYQAWTLDEYKFFKNDHRENEDMELEMK